ncbi:MAG: hypothetical protein ACRENL_03385 [Candidatus Dormibacteria bacterium]
MAEHDIPEGYPDSPSEETTPAEPAISLESADRESEEEGEVSPAGAAPEAGDREDAFADSPDADQLAAAELTGPGSRPEDAANFEDNAADWSRRRG